MFKENVLYVDGGMELFQRIGNNSMRFPRKAVIAAILMVALLAFEIFNFDTTRFALTNLLGPVAFAGLRWASILAVAFCAIDFAGLVRMFTPDSEGEQPKEVWYLMGAWLLGATMNALMTWWAVSLTLLSHDFGNEVLSRGQLLQIVPIFVATLVWLTRILFIGALTVTGSQLIHGVGDEEQVARAAGRPNTRALPTGAPVMATHSGIHALSAQDRNPTLVSHHGNSFMSDELPAFLKRRVEHPEATESMHEMPIERQARTERIRPADVQDAPPMREREAPPKKEEEPVRNRAVRSVPNGRVRQRPPMPGANGFHARSRGRN